MRSFEVHDNVVLKTNPTLRGWVSRTHVEAFDPFDDQLVCAYTEVPLDVLTEFAESGIPPDGYVFVEFLDQADGTALVSEQDLHLLGRCFLLGDPVTQEGKPLSGTVIDVADEYILEPVTLGDRFADFLPVDSSTFGPCSPQCPSLLPPHLTHPCPHALVYGVPAREVARAQDVVKGDYLLVEDWLGRVADIQYDIILALKNKSIVVITSVHKFRVVVRDHGKPFIAFPETDDVQPPNLVGASQGYPDTIPFAQPQPGLFVLTNKESLRKGRWLRGSFNPKGPAEGIILDVRAHDVSVDYVSCDLATMVIMTPFNPGQDQKIYENGGDYVDSKSLRQHPKVVVYDAGRAPSKLGLLPAQSAAAPSTETDGRPEPQPANTHHVYSGQLLRPGDCVRFRDPTAAAVKYQGSLDTGHGRYVRLHDDDFGGWDLNVFRILAVDQRATVLWQDGTVETMAANDLQIHQLLETEIGPTDIVVRREGMRQRLLDGKPAGPGNIRDFDEMTFFERAHDLLPKSVGVVQTVDPTERVARVRWFTAPHLELRSSGQYLGPSSYFGPIGDQIDDVSLYEIMSFPCLLRQRRDLCVWGPPEPPRATQHPDPVSTRASDPDLAPAPREGTRAVSADAADSQPQHRRPARPKRQAAKEEHERKNDWVGEIVGAELNGNLSVRLGAAVTCRDISVPPDCILALVDDGEALAASDDEFGSDQWSNGAWSHESTEPLHESIEYEGGIRLDDDGGSEAWVSDDDEHFTDAIESLPDGTDEDMPDVDAAENPDPSSKPDRGQSLAQVYASRPAEMPPRFTILDRDPPADQYGLDSPSDSPKFLKRIVRDHRILASSLPHNEIFVRTYESRLDLLRCLIIGPKDTPYEGAPFLVDLHLPPEFPDEPPNAHFHSWTSGMGRINPNLYEDGKICLSLLGTWTGKDTSEKWSPKATILQLLISLQGLVFVKAPFYNEAGFEGYENDRKYAREADQYTEKAFVMSRGFLKYALLRPPGALEDILAWLYLPPGSDTHLDLLLPNVVDRGYQLIRKSEAARAIGDQQFVDSAGETGDDTRAFIRPLSRGASVMLSRMLDELQGHLQRLGPT